MKQFYVYILANKPHGTLYIGVTSDLVKRVYQHKEKITGGFTERYAVNRLVYYEFCQDIVVAVAREKQLKKWKREFKIELIESMNSEWKDLYDDLLG